jgi:filamentous hemagglutinin family protein
MGRLFISQKQAVLSGLAIFTTGMAATAQVVMDGSLGRAGTLQGPDYAITADLGQQHGGNLFHSFGQFSLQTGESATFSGPGSVSAIIGRVTGGQLSRIDGTLRSTIPNANLYLLNPAGVLFGEQATLDVSGSVHVSTADYLKLGGGGRFDARASGNSVLTVAPVTAFGFLGDAPGKIAISGSFLQVREGQTLSLIGGDITLNNAHLYAPAGRINLAAAASMGEVIPTDADLVMRGFAKMGGLTLTQTDDPRQASPILVGEVDVSGEGGGAIFVRGGQWFNQGGWVLANTYGAQGGGEINIAVADDLTLQKGGVISASTYGGRRCREHCDQRRSAANRWTGRCAHLNRYRQQCPAKCRWRWGTGEYRRRRDPDYRELRPNSRQHLWHRRCRAYFCQCWPSTGGRGGGWRTVGQPRQFWIDWQRRKHHPNRCR